MKRLIFILIFLLIPSFLFSDNSTVSYSITQYTIQTAHITDNEYFNYFFTLIMFFGLIGWLLAIPMKLINRS